MSLCSLTVLWFTLVLSPGRHVSPDHLADFALGSSSSAYQRPLLDTLSFADCGLGKCSVLLTLGPVASVLVGGVSYVHSECEKQHHWVQEEGHLSMSHFTEGVQFECQINVQSHGLHSRAQKRTGSPDVSLPTGLRCKVFTVQGCCQMKRSAPHC